MTDNGVLQASIIDHYGEIDRERQELRMRLKPVEAECKKLETAMAGWYATWPAEDTAIAEGDRYTLQISACESRTRILDIRKVARAMGASAFYGVTKIALEAIKVAVGEAKYLTLVVTARSGPRTVKAVPKAQQSQAAELQKAA